jgi:hypothetical protein
MDALALKYLHLPKKYLHYILYLEGGPPLNIKNNKYSFSIVSDVL